MKDGDKSYGRKFVLKMCHSPIVDVNDAGVNDHFYGTWYVCFDSLELLFEMNSVDNFLTIVKIKNS